MIAELKFSRQVKANLFLKHLSRRLNMKTTNNNTLAKMILATAALFIIPQLAFSQLLIDDFSTGPYQKALKSGTDTNFQSGSMVGGSRETSFFACVPTDCGRWNPFGQPSSFQIQPKTKTSPAALVFNGAYKSQAYLGVLYGFSAPMTLELASSYDRLRVTFDSADQAVNFNIIVWSNGGALYSQTGCWLSDPGAGTSFTVDFPFADFTPGGGTPGASFSGINYMEFLFDGAQGTLTGEDWAVTSLQAIPIGAPAANVTCNGLGT
jgi:hypothetical protein